MTTQTKTRRKPAKGRTETKIGTVIRLLKRKQGASLNELVKVTGWQPHILVRTAQSSGFFLTFFVKLTQSLK